MALDATIGGSTSDSYVDVADTTAYFLTRLYSDDWNTAPLANQESALKWATRLLEVHDWVGSKDDEAQALRWPRSGVYDRDNYEILSSTMPQWLKNATGELAIQLLKADRTADPDTRGVSRIKIDTIEIDVDKYDQVQVIPDSVNDIIAFYKLSSGITLVRA